MFLHLRLSAADVAMTLTYHSHDDAVAMTAHLDHSPDQRVTFALWRSQIHVPLRTLHRRRSSQPLTATADWQFRPRKGHWHLHTRDIVHPVCSAIDSSQNDISFNMQLRSKRRLCNEELRLFPYMTRVSKRICFNIQSRMWRGLVSNITKAYCLLPHSTPCTLEISLSRWVYVTSRSFDFRFKSRHVKAFIKRCNQTQSDPIVSQFVIN